MCDKIKFKKRLDLPSLAEDPQREASPFSAASINQKPTTASTKLNTLYSLKKVISSPAAVKNLSDSGNKWIIAAPRKNPQDKALAYDRNAGLFFDRNQYGIKEHTHEMTTKTKIQISFA